MCICVRSTFVSHICIRYILNDTRVCMCIAYITYVTIQQMCICVRNTLVSHICIRMFSHMTQYTWCIYVIFFFRIYIFRIYAHLLTIHVVYMWCTPISTHIIEYTIVYCVICENMRVHHIYYTFQNSSHVHMCANYMSITYRHQVYSIMCVYACASYIYHFVWYGMGICNALTCALHISVCVCVCVCVS